MSEELKAIMKTQELILEMLVQNQTLLGAMYAEHCLLFDKQLLDEMPESEQVNFHTRRIEQNRDLAKEYLNKHAERLFGHAPKQ